MEEYLKKKNYNYCKDEFPFESWRSKDGLIIVTKGLSNREGCDWSVHVDNEDFETIGSLDFQEIEDFEKFLRLMGIEP